MTKSVFAGLIIAAAFLSSCEEEPLPIVLVEGEAPLQDTTFVNSTVSAPQDKNVLFEDFTGVRCPTCPNGHQAIKDMQANYPGRIVAVAIHAGGQTFVQAFPFPGDQDLNTDWGNQIFTIVAKPNGIPYGYADRIAGGNITTQWEGLCTPRMALNTQANADARVISYDPVTRELRYEVKFEMMEDLDESLFFSTVITEDSIIGRQEYTQGEYHEYEHNHILRDMPQFKENLNPNKTPAASKGRVFLKQYSYTLPSEWVAEQCHLVTYIHRDIEVLQVSEVKIK